MRHSFGFVGPGGTAMLVPFAFCASMTGCQQTPAQTSPTGQVEIEALPDVPAANVYVLLASEQDVTTRWIWHPKATSGLGTSICCQPPSTT